MAEQRVQRRLAAMLAADVVSYPGNTIKIDREALRQGLDHEYEARNGLNPKPSADAIQTSLSGTSQT